MPSLCRVALLALVVAVHSMSCGGSTGTGTGGGGGAAGGGGGAAGGGGGSTGGGGGGGAGGGGAMGTPVTIDATTQTTTIPLNSMNCMGNTLGSKADLQAVNLPVFVGTTQVTAFTLRYDMGSFFGEPTRAAVCSWEGTGSLGAGVQWVAEVHNQQGRQYVNAGGQRVFASYSVGTVKGPGEGFGFDTTGSPSWSQTFVTWDAATATTKYEVTTDEAKNIYRACFTLANVRLVRLNGDRALKP